MDQLFTNYDLSGLVLSNRLVMAPMTRARNTDTIPNDLTALYYQQRASAGLIITEGSQISTQGVGYLFTPGMHTEEQVAGWKKVTAAVHNAGGKIFAQIWHVGRISHVSLHENGTAPVGPTAKLAKDTPSFAYDENGNPSMVQASQPRALLTAEVKAIVQEFVDASANAMTAGFDGVEIHGANGYLLEQFINAAVNDRADEYGGDTIQSRIRFTLEVVDAVVAKVGKERVGIRLSPLNRKFDMPTFKEEEQTWLELAKELSKRNLAYVHISNRDVLVATDEGTDFLRRFRQTYEGTLILAGLYTKAEGEHDIGAGLTDLVAIGRPFISNPDLVERLKNDWPLTTPDESTFYGGDHRGYSDYSVHES